MKIKPIEVKEIDEYRIYTIKTFIIIKKKEKIRDPVKFLTSQVKLKYDAVKLVRKFRENIEKCIT